MKKYIIRAVVRSSLKLQSREKSCRELRRWEKLYLDAGTALTEENGAKGARVPEMVGVDPEMTNWSYYQLLEHNAIVNEAMSRNVRMLLTGEGRAEVRNFNPKTDVLPSASAGKEQVEHFKDSVQQHLDMLVQFPSLKSSETNDHPLFGAFDAHMWHAMMGFHLKVHYKQLKGIISQV